MLSSLIAGLLLIQPQDAPKDVKLPVMPMWQFGQWLGEQTGMQVIVLPQVQDKLIYINVKHRTLPEIYGFVEKALGVEVLDKNGVLTLRESANYTKAGAMSVKGLQATIDKLDTVGISEQDLRAAMPELKSIEEKQRSAGMSANDPLWKRMVELSRLDPVRTALNKFLKRLGGGPIANQAMYENVVYSTAPTRYQRGWPGSPEADIRALNDAMQMRNSVVQEMTPDDSGFAVFQDSGIQQSQLRTVAGGVSQPVSAMLVSLRKMPYGVEVTLKTFDKQGIGIVMTTDQLLDEQLDRLQKSIEELEAKNKDLDAKFVLSEDQQHEFTRMGAFFGGGTSNETMTRADVEWLAQVDVHEPFGGVVTKLFDFAMEQSGSEIVTEVMMPMSQRSQMKEVSAGEAMTMLCMQSFLEPVEPVRGGLIIGKPTADWVRQFIVSRPAIASIARQIWNKGKLTLDDLADGVAKLSSSDQVMFFVPAALTVSGQAGSYNSVEPRGWNEFLLTTYAQLTPEQRRTVFSDEGLVLNLTAVPANVRDSFWSSVWGSSMQMSVPYEADPDGQGQHPAEMVGGVKWTNWNREPTVFLTLPNSMPIQIRLRGATEDGLMVMRSYPQPDGSAYDSKSFERVDSFAHSQAWAEVSSGQDGYRPPTIAGVAAANQIQLTMSVQFGAFTKEETTFSMLGSPVGKLGGEGDLPPEVKARIDSERAKARENYERYRQNPPPQAPASR